MPLSLNELLGKYLSESLSEEERELFQSMLQDDHYRHELETLIDGYAREKSLLGVDDDRLRKMSFVQLKERIHLPAIPRAHFIRTAWFRYAAILLLLLGTGVYFWLQQHRQQTRVSDSNPMSVEVPPGKEGAILTLADGTQVVLDSLGNGVIASQNGSQVVLNNGQLTYSLAGKITGKMMYNQVVTPKGRQFSVVLPDGTRVWLNAASSLRYPTSFFGSERQVAITGEAYFEVVKDKAKPFLVKINNEATVEVLGTSFNVNAYEDEASINTTLMEGSVKVAVAALGDPQLLAAAILKPGQQAEIVPVSGRAANASGAQAKSGIRLIKKVNIDKVMAWKNGAFNFDGASLEEVMRQLERWYDIEVVYEKGIPDIRFGGELSRDVSLAGLLRTLVASKVHFRMEEGRRLVVFP